MLKKQCRRLVRIEVGDTKNPKKTGNCGETRKYQDETEAYKANTARARQTVCSLENRKVSSKFRKRSNIRNSGVNL